MARPSLRISIWSGEKCGNLKPTETFSSILSFINNEKCIIMDDYPGPFNIFSMDYLVFPGSGLLFSSKINGIIFYFGPDTDKL